MANYDSGVRYDEPNGRYDDVSAANQIKRMDQKKISASLAAADLAAVLAAVATIRTKLPFLISLSADERKHLANVTEQSQGVVLSAINFVAQHPEALPGTFDTAEFTKDANLLSPMQQVASAIAQLNRDTDDTLRALHGDLYSEFLDFYAIAKTTNRNGGYDEFINAVKGRFAKSPRKTKTPAT